MRPTVRMVSVVCSVASTRWPVSAALSAISIVSSSRISPTKMTSGSWRSAARNAAAKLAVSIPISRWLMLDIWSLCMNSIGSSTVTMCSERVALRCAIMLAIDVLLPFPAAPTTSTIPFCFSTSSRVTGIG